MSRSGGSVSLLSPTSCPAFPCPAVLASFPPGSKVTRNEFATRLNEAVQDSGREIGSEGARRLLNFLASDEGHNLVHHVARGTTYTLHTENIRRRCAEAASEVSAAIAAAALAAVAVAAPAAVVTAAPAQRFKLSDPELQPIKAIVATMVQFGAVSSGEDDPNAPDSVGGYVTISGLAASLGVETAVARDLMAALEDGGFVATPGHGGASKHKGRAVLVTPRTRHLLRSAESKLATAAGLQQPPLLRSESSTAVLSSAGASSLGASVPASESQSGRAAGVKRSFHEHQDAPAPLPAPDLRRASRLRQSAHDDSALATVVPSKATAAVALPSLPARSSRSQRVSSAAVDLVVVASEVKTAVRASVSTSAKPIGAGAWEAVSESPLESVPLGAAGSCAVPLTTWGTVSSVWARPPEGPAAGGIAK